MRVSSQILSGQTRKAERMGLADRADVLRERGVQDDPRPLRGRMELPLTKVSRTEKGLVEGSPLRMSMQVDRLP